jgi:hypothetical protein
VGNGVGHPLEFNERDIRGAKFSGDAAHKLY